MPNWCNNSITITGPKAKIENLWKRSQGSTPNSDFGLLNAMVPMPKQLEGTTSPSPKEGEPQPLVDGHDNWYDWRVENWGCKWDVDDTGLEFEDCKDGYATISGWFDSPWAPPIEAYNTWLEENKDCTLESFYEEGGMDFAGHYDSGSDDYIEGISDYARKVVKGEASGSALYDFLDGEMELTENRRDWIEEELNEDAQKVHDFIVEKKAVNGTSKSKEAVDG